MTIQFILVGLLFQLLAWSPLGNWLFASIKNDQKRSDYIVLFQRVAIAALFSIASYSTTLSTNIGMGFTPLAVTIMLVAGLLALGFNYLLVTKSQDKTKALQVKNIINSNGYFALNVITWVLYLVSYEYYLRGVMLHYLMGAFSIYTAIAINVLFYAFLHVQKNWTEVFLSLPFGILLCWVTLYTHSIIPAIAIHTLVALSHDSLVVYFVRKVMTGSQ